MRYFLAVYKEKSDRNASNEFFLKNLVVVLVKLETILIHFQLVMQIFIPQNLDITMKFPPKKVKHWLELHNQTTHLFERLVHDFFYR
jgi:hypothetical protein